MDSTAVSNPTKLNGSCLCGAVQVTATATKKIFDVCHCGMCRKWGGGPLMSIGVQPGYEIKGEESLSIYESSDWAQRGFCKKCGSHLFYRMKGHEFCNMPVGIFQNTQDFEFHMQIYVDAKPAHYAFADKTEMLTEAQVIELFTPKS